MMYRKRDRLEALVAEHRKANAADPYVQLAMYMRAMAARKAYAARVKAHTAWLEDNWEGR
jgi:hypothetical protein